MPLSSNAPFNEFGNSMILRDIEQIWLTINGSGTGSAGDGQTQDQSAGVTQETGDSGGQADLSGLATTDYVDAAIADIPSVADPLAIANGGTKPNGSTYYSSGSGTFTVPAGVNRVIAILIGGGGGGAGNMSDVGTLGYCAATSGGAVTSAITKQGLGGSGGSGAFVFCSFDVSPGGSITYAVGANGATGTSGAVGVATSGAAGSDTSITYNSVQLVAGGGGGGGAAGVNTPGTAGTRGLMSGLVPGSNGLAFSFGSNGSRGIIRVDVGGSVNDTTRLGGPGFAIVESGSLRSNLGTGGNFAGTAATSGAIAFFY
jgi:hypothetical protein